MKYVVPYWILLELGGKDTSSAMIIKLSDKFQGLRIVDKFWPPIWPHSWLRK